MQSQENKVRNARHWIRQRYSQGRSTYTIGCCNTMVPQSYKRKKSHVSVTFSTRHTLRLQESMRINSTRTLFHLRCAPKLYVLLTWDTGVKKILLENHLKFTLLSIVSLCVIVVCCSYICCYFDHHHTVLCISLTYWLAISANSFN